MEIFKVDPCQIRTIYTNYNSQKNSAKAKKQIHSRSFLENTFLANNKNIPKKHKKNLSMNGVNYSEYLLNEGSLLGKKLGIKDVKTSEQLY
jgi:hypothetical protein